MGKVFIIAEAGVNHNGDINLAKKLINLAVEAGADAVKFQTFISEKLVAKEAKKAEYQIKFTGGQESQFSMVKKLELSFSDFAELQKYCNTKNIIFLSTPFDHESIDFLTSLKIPIMKLASGEITNLPYLRKIGGLGMEVIISTGMCNLGEIENAIQILIDAGTSKEKITVLHCNTEYPTPKEDVNLNAMLTIREAFKVNVGYSDHTLGIEVPVAAVALGATVIEKHFTLDKTLDGPDHMASLDPDELKAMVVAIRNIEKAMGDGIKRPSESELKNKNLARRSIYLAKELTAGHIINEEDLIMKRPGNGISPLHLDWVIGKKIKKELPADYMLTLNDIE